MLKGCVSTQWTALSDSSYKKHLYDEEKFPAIKPERTSSVKQHKKNSLGCLCFFVSLMRTLKKIILKPKNGLNSTLFVSKHTTRNKELREKRLTMRNKFLNSLREMARENKNSFTFIFIFSQLILYDIDQPT